MEATLESLPLQNTNPDFTTTNGNFLYSLEEGKGSPSNGFNMVFDRNEGTESPYETSFQGRQDSFTSEIDNLHQDEDTRKLMDNIRSSSSKQSTEENGLMANHRKIQLRDLQGVFDQTVPHEFYCPNCKIPITEVIVSDIEPRPPTTPPALEHKVDIDPRPPTPPVSPFIRCISCFGFLFGPDGIFRPKPPEQVADPPPVTTVVVIPVIVEPPPRPLPPDGNKTLEILKSIVYGGLTEAIASLSIVASAASAETATLNIFVLALANLLGGLFIIGHNLWELKAGADSKYREILGNKDNFFFHAPVAILSFLIFGLVPPLVYGFSFRESDDGDLKIAAVAASSLLCIVLLAIGKAYFQTTPNKYIKIVPYYVVVGVGVAGLSYLAGDLLEKLVEQLGWFSTTLAAGSLPLPHQTMSLVKPAWESW